MKYKIFFKLGVLVIFVFADGSGKKP